MSNINVRLQAMLSVFALFALSACATTLKSSVQTAENVELESFKTYAWITDQPLLVGNTVAPNVVNPINERRIRVAVEKQLETKGYQKASPDQADLVVAFSLGARDRVRVQNYYDDFGFGYYGFYSGFSRLRGPGLRRSTSVRTFTEGTLVVDVFENAQKEAIWHGSASKRLSTEDSTKELIDEAVTTLFAEFPDRGEMDEMMKDLKS